MYKFPNSHICDVLDIAAANHADTDVAFRMFMNNVDDAFVENDPYVYKGAVGVDWKKLHAIAPRKGTQEYADMCNKYDADFDANNEKIIELWQAQKTLTGEAKAAKRAELIEFVENV